MLHDYHMYMKNVRIISFTKKGTKTVTPDAY